MRLHRLAVTGFGPFRDEQVVDFDSLSDAGLFLLTGHTGAGKSSVLDAVTYALYGQVPGARASILRVRSDHADPAAPTVVELELTVRGTRLRVRRTPDWDRPKKRGDGTTRERGKVLLERLEAGSWQFLSSRHDEVGHELAGLLGLNHDQFCQVVLLPQGAFASFLGADAESRKQLLERLFGTERFSAVEGWLAALRSSRAEAFLQQLELRNELTARLADVADEAEGPQREESDAAVLAWADSFLAELGGRRIAAADQVRAGTVDVAEREGGLAHALHVDGLHRRVSELLARQRIVVAGESQRRVDAAELAAATTASALAPQLETLDELGDAVTEARARVRDGRAQVTRLGVPGDGDGEALRARERDLHAELTRLDDLSADAARLACIDVELEATEARVGDSRAELAEHVRSLATAPARREQLDATAREAELAAALLPDLEAELAPAQGRVSAAARRDVLRRQRTTGERMHRAAIERVQLARTHLLDLRERRLDGMAAELAAALAPGAACPVCGSVAHPQLAAATDAVDETAEQDARTALQVAEATLQEADSRLRSVAEKHAAARVAAGGDEDAAFLQAEFDGLARRYAAVELAAAALPRALAAVREHDATTAAMRSAAQGAQVVCQVGDVRAAELRSDREALHCRVVAAQGDDADLPSRVTRLAAAADALAGIALARRDEAHSQRARSAAERRLDRAARAAGFDSAATSVASLRGEDRIVELSDAISDHDREAHVVASGLAEPELSGLAPQSQAGLSAALAAAQHDVAEAAARLAAVQAQFTRLEAAHVKALKLHGDLVSAVTRLRPLRAAFETADTLAKLAAGTGADNKLRMRLSYYVLSARLEQVAAAASERLLRMSDGRFALRHTDERSGGNQRSGLGLLVCDGWYGTTRDPSTLSGGESFMASLALALGLADVVVAEAGGTVMDTLFVDEGFGSLDDETLDAVLGVLDGLREGGRAVGVVSHVSDLRDRIPAQLAVRKAPRGSTLRLSA